MTHSPAFAFGLRFSLATLVLAILGGLSTTAQAADLSGHWVGSWHYLGRMFGTFTYYAEATSCRFHASYNSCKDAGQFNLSR